MKNYYDKLEKILGVKEELLFDLEKRGEEVTGKSKIIEKIWEENEFLIRSTFEKFNFPENSSKREKIYKILISKIKEIEKKLFEFLGKPNLNNLVENCDKFLKIVQELNRPSPGFFIKKEKALEALEKFPPQKMLDLFGYKSAAELVEKQGLSAVFSALRFVQDNEWMHNFFEKAYSNLTFRDFEEREVEIKILEPEWFGIGEGFIEKKYHNLSHLKELGIIFIIPIKITSPGEFLRIFILLLHYLNEVPFYSKLFKKISREENFQDKFKSLLRGDVLEVKDERYKRKNGKIRWLIIQRYLAKDNKKDSRLFLPHINPEAEHWYKAEKDLAKLDLMIGNNEFGFWQNLDFVADFFNGELVPFNLVDLTMSLVKNGEVKYLYHQKEALWNKIFLEFFGREKMNEIIEENIIKGYIEI